jgi:excisionase family DNA binding protein
MNIQNITPKYFTRYEAAGHLRVSPKTIDRLIRNNRIEAFKIGNRVLILIESLTQENINSIKPKFLNQRY